MLGSILHAIVGYNVVNILWFSKVSNIIFCNGCINKYMELNNKTYEIHHYLVIYEFSWLFLFIIVIKVMGFLMLVVLIIEYKEYCFYDVGQSQIIVLCKTCTQEIIGAT